MVGLEIRLVGYDPSQTGHPEPVIKVGNGSSLALSRAIAGCLP